MSFSDLCSDILNLIFSEVHPCYYIDLAQVCKDWSKMILKREFIYSMYSKWICQYNTRVKQLMNTLPNLNYKHLAKDAALMWPIKRSSILYNSLSLCNHAIDAGYSEENCMEYLNLQHYGNSPHDSLIIIDIIIRAWKRRYKNILTYIDESTYVKVRGVKIISKILLIDLDVNRTHRLQSLTLNEALNRTMNLLINVYMNRIKWACIEDYAEVVIRLAQYHSGTPRYDLCEGICTSNYEDDNVVFEGYVNAGYIIGKYMDKVKLHKFIDDHELEIDKNQIPAHRVNSTMLDLDVVFTHELRMDLLEGPESDSYKSLLLRFRPDLSIQIGLVFSGALEYYVAMHNPYYIRMVCDSSHLT